MRKIAVVDDVEDNREFLYFILNEHYEVARYGSGEEALDRLRQDVPDLIILDISLPDISGFAVLESIRKNQEFGDIPVIAVTAHAMAGDREKCLVAGFDDYVSKPILDVDEFLQRIEHHLDRHSS